MGIETRHHDVDRNRCRIVFVLQDRCDELGAPGFDLSPVDQRTLNHIGHERKNSVEVLREAGGADGQLMPPRDDGQRSAAPVELVRDVRRRSALSTAIEDSSRRTLQEAGLIKYVRGRITILDRGRLESASCACYGIIQREFDRLLGHQ